MAKLYPVTLRLTREESRAICEIATSARNCKDDPADIPFFRACEKLELAADLVHQSANQMDGRARRTASRV